MGLSSPGPGLPSSDKKQGVSQLFPRPPHPRSTYDGEGAQAPSSWCLELIYSPPPESLGAASPENEPEATSLASLQCASEWAAWGTGTLDSSVTMQVRREGYTFFPLEQLRLIRIRGQCPHPSPPCQAFGTKVNGREKATYLGVGSRVSKGESFLTLTLHFGTCPFLLPEYPTRRVKATEERAGVKDLCPAGTPGRY